MDLSKLGKSHDAWLEPWHREQEPSFPRQACGSSLI